MLKPRHSTARWHKVFRSSASSLSVSADGTYAASLSNGALEIFRLDNLTTIRNLAVDVEKGTVRWTNSTDEGHGPRFLVQSNHAVSVWDLNNEDWVSQISNGSGATGRIISADFGASPDEIITISEFSSKLTIWSLMSGRSVEIRDPKPIADPYTIRPSGGVLALLSRSAVQDVLTLHAMESHAVLKTVLLQTIDARGLRWSPDGHWLAIWDAASQGCRCQLLTSDATPFRMLEPKDFDHADEHETMLGIKTLAWAPNGNLLAIGGLQKQVQIFGTRTFVREMTLSHFKCIEDNSLCKHVWQEVLHTAAETHAYQRAPLPISLPTPTSAKASAASPTGITLLTYNADGSLLATKDDAAPSTVWVWNLASRQLESIIIQLTSIRRLIWHPSRPGLLLILVDSDTPAVIYVWEQGLAQPFVIDPGFVHATGKIDMQWIARRHDQSLQLLLRADNQMMYLDLTTTLTLHSVSSNLDDSFDSVCQALTG